MRRAAAVVVCLVAAFMPFARADRQSATTAHNEGMAALQRKDVETAMSAFSRAIAEDPTWDEPLAMRGRCKALLTTYAAAVEDYSRALGLSPNSPTWHILRCQSLMALDHWGEAAEDAEAVLRGNPDLPEALSLHGWALVNLGDVDRGLAEQTRAYELGKKATYLLRFDGFARKADWAALANEAEQGIAGGVTRPSLYFFQVVGLVEQGKFKEAREVLLQARQRIGNHAELEIAEGYLLGTPAAGVMFDPIAALSHLENTAGSSTSYSLNTRARVLYLADRVHECLELLSTRGRRTNFDTLFWMGLAQWRLGQLPEARATLLDARRLNPYLLKQAERIPGFKDFVASIDRDLASEGSQPADRASLSHEMATHLLTVAEIEALVRRYDFARAVSEYEKLLPALKSAVRKAEVETRLPEVKGMAGAHGKLVAGVTKGTLKLTTTIGKTDLAIVKANASAFEFTIAGGTGKFPWAFLDPVIYVGFAMQASLTPEEIFGLGCLASDSGNAPLAFQLFEEATKKKSDLRKNLFAFVARKRGMPIPPSGFVPSRGSWVTPEEKANIEKGLVLFQGKWVPAKDKEQLAKGMTQIDGKWVPGQEAELLKRGYRKYKDKWMTREDYEALRGQWSDCFTEETAHYIVKSNSTESYTRDLAALVEVAYGELKTYYGGLEPKLSGKEKMTLHAYRTYEDYRKFCVENKMEDQLNAAGFARSDSNVVVGWDKTGNARQFLQTMVHEASHLYFFRVAPAARPASWYAEAMATYFEGFGWNGKTYAFNFISDSRLPFARDAMKGGRHIPLKDLLGGNALALINSDSQKALLFYAECWALNYYLSQTDNKVYREAYAAYRKDIATGGQKGLLEYFPDAAKLEKDWIEAITGL